MSPALFKAEESSHSLAIHGQKPAARISDRASPLSPLRGSQESAPSAPRGVARLKQRPDVVRGCLPFPQMSATCFVYVRRASVKDCHLSSAELQRIL